MGDRRKLQAEIDRTLKKIDEGVEVFDRIFNKTQARGLLIARRRSLCCRTAERTTTRT